MSRRSRLFTLVALVAAVAAAGCYPVVSNQRAAQKDLIGDVNVGGEVCTAPLVLPFLIETALSGVLTPGDVLRASHDAAARRKLERTAKALTPGAPPEWLFGCPNDEDLEDILSGGFLDETELAIAAGIPHQVLVAYRVPQGFKAPASFTAKGKSRVSVVFDPTAPVVDRGGPNIPSHLEDVNVTFKRAPEMDGQLVEYLADALKVVRDGDQLVGYVSSTLPGPLSGDLDLDAGFGLPNATSPEPFAGSFNGLTLVGSRIAVDEKLIGGLPRAAGARALRGIDPEDVIGGLSADRPVQCLQTDESLPIVRGARRGPPSAILELFGLAYCPMPDIAAEIGSDEDREDLLRGVDAQVRDLRIVGGEAFAEQGSTASVPFTFRTTGPASDQQLALTAATALGGATASPAQATTTFPAAGNHARSVNVQIPADAAPGTYEVTMTASIGGQTRLGGGRVVVLPKAVLQQQASQRGRDNVYMDASGNIAFGWICPPACGSDQVDVTAPKAGIAPKANTAQVSKPRLLRIARSKFKANAGKRVRVKVRLFPKARRAVKKGRNVKAIIIVRKGGKGVPSIRRVVIKQRKAKR
jgi:hypothetical protein